MLFKWQIVQKIKQNWTNIVCSLWNNLASFPWHPLSVSMLWSLSNDSILREISSFCPQAKTITCTHRLTDCNFYSVKYKKCESQHPQKGTKGWHWVLVQTRSSSEPSSLLLFSKEAINLDPVTEAEGGDSTLHRWVMGHEQALGPIRAGVANMEVPGCHSQRMWPQCVVRLRLVVKRACHITPVVCFTVLI